MGKHCHPRASPYIRHVQFTTKHTTRGPKLVKQQVKKKLYRSGPSKSRGFSENPAEQLYDDGSYTPLNANGGKVILTL
jgi:hypothetical protein